MGYWGDTYAQQSKVINQQLVSLYKYHKYEIEGLNELGETTGNYQRIYEKKNQLLKAKKEKLWKARDVSKWELPSELKANQNQYTQDLSLAMKVMLPSETMEVEKSKRDFMLMLNQVFHEVK